MIQNKKIISFAVCSPCQHIAYYIGLRGAGKPGMVPEQLVLGFISLLWYKVDSLRINHRLHTVEWGSGPSGPVNFLHFICHIH